MHVITTIKPVAAMRRSARRLARDRRGTALLEFAFAMPIVLTLGMYGIETANLALVNLRVSQIALNLADNASRVGIASGLSTVQIREVDINDIFQGVRLQGAGINIAKYGRITLSSVENVQQKYDSAPVQRIHWQRCLGLMKGNGYDSAYTTTKNAGSSSSSSNRGTDVPDGVKDPEDTSGPQITAPPGSGLMFVEVNYQYQPLLGSWLIPASRVHYVASFIVRDRRDFAQIYNPSPTQPRAYCTTYSS